MSRLLLRLPVAALALTAGGCGSGVPQSFRNCRDSASRGGPEDAAAVLPPTFDCLVRAYRQGCSAARATIDESGVDTIDTMDVRVYRRDARCAGDVVASSRVDGARYEPRRLRCRQTYLFRGRLTLYGCGDEGEFAFVRGRDCSRRLRQARTRECRRAGVKCPPLRALRPFAS